MLVVDEDPDALEFASAILTGTGAPVRTRLSAPEALDALRQRRAEALVSGIEMPGENGYSPIRNVRVLDETKGRGLPPRGGTPQGE